MRAILVTALFATAVSSAFAAPRTPNWPAPKTLCSVQGDAANANCPLIKVQGQDARSCLPGLSGSSETSPSKPTVGMGSHDRK